MGLICHNAIVISGDSEGESLRKAREYALSLQMTVSDIIHSPTNMYASFFVTPDGSKEGWETSEEGDLNRQAFYVFLRKETPGLTWAGVRYGNDSVEMLAYIEDCSV
jgi:hypothetical protein